MPSSVDSDAETAQRNFAAQPATADGSRSKCSCGILLPMLLFAIGLALILPSVLVFRAETAEGWIMLLGGAVFLICGLMVIIYTGCCTKSSSLLGRRRSQNRDQALDASSRDHSLHRMQRTSIDGQCQIDPNRLTSIRPTEEMLSELEKGNKDQPPSYAEVVANDT